MKFQPHVFSRWRQWCLRRFPNFSTRQTVGPGRLLVLALALGAALALLHSLVLGHSHWNHWVTSGQAKLRRAVCWLRTAGQDWPGKTLNPVPNSTAPPCTVHCTVLHPPKQEEELVEAWCNSYGRAGPGGPGVTGHICLFRSFFETLV